MDRICDLARRLQQLLELVCCTLRLGRPLRQRPLKGTITVRIPTPVNKGFSAPPPPPPPPSPQSVYLLSSIAQAMHQLVAMETRKAIKQTCRFRSFPFRIASLECVFTQKGFNLISYALYLGAVTWALV